MAKATNKLGIIKNGKLLTTRQIQREIRQGLHLTKSQFNKYYDITRNKLRNFERTTGAKKQSVLKFLYLRVRYKEKARREGFKYIISNKARYIEKFTSVSSGKKDYVLTDKLKEDTTNYIKNVYGSKETGTGLIAKNEYAQKIMERFKGDPVKQLKALNEFANRRNDLIKQTADGQVDANPVQKGREGGTNTDYDEEAYNDAIDKYGGGK